MTTQLKTRTGGRGIEWTDRTENPVGGCLHGCQWQMPDGTIARCYAHDVAEGVAGRAYRQGFEHHYWRGDRGLADMIRGRKPELIFIDSMSDLFGAHVPEEHTRAVLQQMRLAPQHVYQSLTKAPGRLRKFIGDLPRNLWVGVSSPPDWFMGQRLSREQQTAMVGKTLDVLRDVRAAGCLTWLSIEPLSWDVALPIAQSRAGLIDWCVIGAASRGSQYYQPDPAHLQGLLSYFTAAEVPLFFKGNLRPSIAAGRLGPWREDFPASYRDGSPIPAVERRQQRCRQFDWTLSRDTVSAETVPHKPR